MKTKSFLFSLCLLLTVSAFAQTTVTWGNQDSRTESRNNAATDYYPSPMSGFFETAGPQSGTYPPGASSWWHLLDVRHSNPNNLYAMQFAGSFFDQNVYFRKTDNWVYRPWSKVVLMNPNGQVGIGTDYPSYTLDVNGIARASNLLAPSLALLDGDLFNYDNQSMYNYGMKWTSDSWTGSGPTFWMSGFGGIKLFTGSQPRLSITAGGNVGIGTTTPPEKFSVEGTIACRRIKVTQSPWPDYVFEKEYSLRSLDSVEAFITTYKHLPDVTPAAQVTSDGLDLGENQAALLKKVEELTLYIIELNKTVKLLTADNALQKVQISKLQEGLKK